MGRLRDIRALAPAHPCPPPGGTLRRFGSKPLPGGGRSASSDYLRSGIRTAVPTARLPGITPEEVRMPRRVVSLVSALGLVLPPFAPSAEATPVTVKVMTLNIFYGGDEWNLRTGQWCVDGAGCPATKEEVVFQIE